MNRRAILLGSSVGLAVLTAALVAVVFLGAGVRADKHQVPLTTTSLRKLSPLPQTDTIRPTGQVKEFHLVARPGNWELVSGVVADAMMYNGQVPGPTIRVTEGDLLRITLKNELHQPTSIHWHGLHVPNDMDGVPPFTQNAVYPGASFTYEFLANHAGTFMYHSHAHENSVEQIDKGLYGLFIIDPQNTRNQPTFDREFTMVLGGWQVSDSGVHDNIAGMPHGMNGMTDGTSVPGMVHDYNYWTVNGKSFPDTERWNVKVGDRVRVRIVNISNASHPMHLHGHDFRIIAEDGHPVANPPILNTIDVAPGKTYEIEFIADNPGIWVFHCHELHHTMNDGIEPGGLITVIEYEGWQKTGESGPASTPAGRSPHAGH